MSADCRFCKIYQNNKDEIIFENYYFYCLFDKFPVSPGHALIISKKHIISLFSLSSQEWRELFSAIKKTVKIIGATDLKKLYFNFIRNPLNKKSELYCQKMTSHLGIRRKPDGYNIGVNEGKAAGRTIDHLHIHIIPRYFADVNKPAGGIRHIIPDKGNYY